MGSKAPVRATSCLRVRFDEGEDIYVEKWHDVVSSAKCEEQEKEAALAKLIDRKKGL